MLPNPTFENDNDDTIPEGVSKLNKIVFYSDTDSGSWRNLLCKLSLPFVPRLDLVLYFLSVSNYWQMLTSELDFASFWAKN